MIFRERGIKMCHYQKIREELGTINYTQTSVKIENPKVNLVEVYATKKKERRQTNDTAYLVIAYSLNEAFI